MRVNKVIIFTNGNIMTLNYEGEQIAECQGCIMDVEVVKNLNKYCDEKTYFYFGDWENKSRTRLNLDWWFKKLKKEKEK